MSEVSVNYYGTTKEISATAAVTTILLNISDSPTGYFTTPWKPLEIMIYRGDTSGTDYLWINVVNIFGIEKPLVSSIPMPPGINAIEVKFASSLNPAEIANIREQPAGSTIKLYYNNASGIGKMVSMTMGVV